MFSDRFKSSVERDAKKITHLAFRLAASDSSPFSVDATILDGYLLDMNWNPASTHSRGGIVEGSAYVDLALYSALENGTPHEGFSYNEDPREVGEFPALHQRPYLEVLACLVAHEVAHAAIFHLALREPSFGYPSDHGHAWQCMYRFLRTNLMFIVSHAAVNELPNWAALAPTVSDELPLIKDFVLDCADRTYDDIDGEERPYGVTDSIELFIEERLMSGSDSDVLVLLAALSTERLGDTYVP